MFCNSETSHCKATFPHVCICIQIVECFYASASVSAYPFSPSVSNCSLSDFMRIRKGRCPVILPIHGNALPNWNNWNTDSETDMDTGKAHLRSSLCGILPHAAVQAALIFDHFRVVFRVPLHGAQLVCEN